MTHLSIKALRHYHELGLLEPDDIDRFTGYRTYTSAQIPIAQVIRRFRDLGMPLDQVRAVIDAPDIETRNKTITAYLTRVERELELTQRRVADVRSLLEGPPYSAPIEYRSIPTTRALAVREVVDVERFGEWWPTALNDLLAAAGPANDSIAGGLYPGEFFELERAEVTLFMPCEQPPALAGGRVEALEIPAVDVAVAVHEGPAEDVDRTYALIGATVAERSIGIDGPIREYYLVGYAHTDDESRHRTEVCWPVFLTANR